MMHAAGLDVLGFPILINPDHPKNVISVSNGTDVVHIVTEETGPANG